MIEIKQLHVNKGERTICSVPELSVRSRERVEIIGANGCGKSTLLRVLAGMERDVCGDCRVDVADQERVYVHQSPYLLRGTVLFNATYGLRSRGVARQERRRLGLEWLERVGLQGMADAPARHLSGGERQRVALVRAMILSPRLLLLDEPLAELDEAGVRCIVEALQLLEETTTLIATPTPLPEEIVKRTYPLRSDGETPSQFRPTHR